jgi:hypothetical protein
VPCTYVHIHAQVWVYFLLANDLSHRAHIYKYTILHLRYNHVIFKIKVYPHVVLCICNKTCLKMKEKS